MAGEILTYGILESLKKSVNEAIKIAIEADGGLASKIGENPIPAIQPTHNWYDSFIGIQATTASAVDSNTLTIPSGDISGIQVGDYMYQKANGKGFVVASKGANSVTVTALDGEATPLTGGFNIFIPSNIEGAETRRNGKYQAQKMTNYTEIFERGVKISNSALASQTYDQSSTLPVQANAAMIDIKNRIQNALFNGKPDDGSASEPRHFGGLDYFVTNRINASGALTYARICKLIKAVRAKGGRPDFLVCNTVHNETLNKIIFDNQRTTVDTSAIGVAANVFIDPISGAKLAIIYDDFCPASKLYVGEIGLLNFTPFRPLTVTELGKKGDNVELSIIEELTLEVHNGANCFGCLEGLTYTE